MALLEAVHLALGQATAAEHFAGTFAMQAVVVAAVFTVGARVVARSSRDPSQPPRRRA